MRLPFRYRPDPQGRRLVVADPGESTDGVVRDMINVLTGFRARLHSRPSTRNLRAVTYAKQPTGAGAGPTHAIQDD
jgi:putative resolvase